MALFLSLLTIFFWGISFIATKIVVGGIPPITLAFFRFVISLAVLAILNFFSKNGNLSKTEKREAMWAGLWGITAYFVFENMGVKFTTPAQASLLISTVPIFTIILADIRRKKASSIKLYFFSSVSLFGVFFITISKGLTFNSGMLGDFLVLVAAVSWAFYTFHIEKLEKSDNILITFEMTKWGTLFLLPISAVELFITPVRFSALRPDFILWILFLGVLCSGLGYAMWNYGVKKLGSRASGNLLYLIPLVSVSMDAIMMKNPPNAYVYIGGTLIMLGVVMSEKVAHWEKIKVSS